MSLAFITTHFNPQRYQRVTAKYQRFRECLGRVPLYGVEISYDGHWETDLPWKILARPDQVLWQKERALNIALDRLPDQFDLVSWIDDDLIPLGDKFVSAIEVMLANVPVCQPFARIHYTDKHGHIVSSVESAASSWAGPSKCLHGVPGGWWAARREALAAGLLDFAITGACDALQLEAWTRTRLSVGVSQILTAGELEAFSAYARKAYKHVRGTLGYCPTDCVHLFHGDMQQRQYRERHNWHLEAAFDPRRDLVIADNGLWRWTRDASPALVARVNKLFALRREDD